MECSGIASVGRTRRLARRSTRLLTNADQNRTTEPIRQEGGGAFKHCAPFWNRNRLSERLTETIAGRVDRREGSGHGTRVSEAFKERIMFGFMHMPEPEQHQDDGFKEFWDAYPNRKAKKDAQKAWAKLKPDAELLATMLDAIEYQKRGRQWRDGFIPLPASWLRGERWTDELDPRRDFYQARL